MLKYSESYGRYMVTYTIMIIYGIGAQGLSKQIGCSEERAQEFMNKYLDSKPAVRGMINATNDFGLKHGYVETMSGFRRYIFEMFSKNKYDISSGIRKCNKPSN